jgi:LuxR family maltose regulon positive regulatory protein
VTSDPRLCVVAAWASLFRGRPAEVEVWLALAESADGHRSPMPGGLGTVGAAVSLVRAGLVAGDVGGQVRAGRQAVERTYETEMWGWIADGCLGIALFWAGELEEARMRIERVVGPLEVADLPQAAALGRAYLALVDLERRQETNAREQLDHALALVRAYHLDGESDTGVVYLARGRLAAHAGDLVAAQVDLERAVALTNRGSNLLEKALAQVELAYILELLDMRERAQPLLDDVSAQLAGLGDPGMLGEKLARTRERLGMVETSSRAPDSELTDRELEVLAYLPGPLTQREIGAALWVSFNTVTSHIRSIYRKLGVSSRHDAVVRAREIDLI